MSDEALYRAPQPPAAEPAGWLTRAVQFPVRVVAFVFFVPTRLAWDAITGIGRWLNEHILLPLANGVRATLRWLRHTLIVGPLRWIWRQVVIPIGRAVQALLRALDALLERCISLLFAPFRWIARVLQRLVLWCAERARTAIDWIVRVVVAPLWRALAAVIRLPVRALKWFFEHVIVQPVQWLWQNLLLRLGRAISSGIRWVGSVIDAVLTWIFRNVLLRFGNAVRWLIFTLTVRPVEWIYRYILRPVRAEVAHLVRRLRAAIAFLVRVLVVQPWQWVGGVVARGWRTLQSAVWTPLATAGRQARKAMRAVTRPIGQARRDAVTSVRRTAARAREDIRRAFRG